MSWRPAAGEDLGILSDFLSVRELTAASLTSRLKSDRGAARLSLPSEAAGILYVHTGAGPEPDAVVYMERSGFSFPVFSDEYCRSPEAGSADAALRRVLAPSANQLFSVMGTRRDVDRFVSAAGNDPYHRVEYLVMSRGPEGTGASISYNGELRIDTAVHADASACFPSRSPMRKRKS
jgi:hypothetical protein